MRILIEGHKYNAEDVHLVLQGIDALENVEGYVCVNYVGYYYNTHASVCDCVFILPKVLLEVVDGVELVFGKYRPEDIINLDANNPLDSKEKEFIYEFAVWIYRSIVVFKEQRKDATSIVYHKQIANVGKERYRRTNSFLDILLYMIQLNRDNRDFFMFVVKNMHSGLNKINWTRTIATRNAIVQNNSAIYLNLVNKKRKINFDEELLVIFFSALNYISETYGFDIPINCNYELIKGGRFKHYLNGYGRVRLRQIKYKYFSDKALEIWTICDAFFSHARNVSINSSHKEYLLVKDFNIVFEAIIDELIGDHNDVPAGLKDQEDGKRVDHMYSYRQLIENGTDKNIYYIGDSKYYKRGNIIGKEAVYKQFTYARNVIQWNLNLFMSKDNDDEDLQKDRKGLKDVQKVRDELTEGYNVIPNFFISATMDEELSYRDDIKLTERDNKYFSSSQFENRLFDRDTLLVCHYDVNFLHVVLLYAKNNRLQKDKWKQKVRRMFREEIQKMLADKYDFYAMRSHPGVDVQEYIRANFKDLLGKVYTPYAQREIMSLALDNEDVARNGELLAKLRQSFYVEKCSIGQDPSEVLPEVEEVVHVRDELKDLALFITKEGIHFDKTVEKIKQTGLVGVALQMNGAVLQLVEGFTTARYLVVHNKSDRYYIFLLKGNGPKLVPGAGIPDMAMTKAKEDLYLVYEVDSAVHVDVDELNLKAITMNSNSYSPHILPIGSVVGGDISRTP